MTFPKAVELYHVPAGVVAEAHVIRLSNAMIRRRMGNAWWDDPALDAAAATHEIDYDWDWTALQIERDGDILSSLKLAVRTGDGAVQGAMMVSTEPVACDMYADSDEVALFVELLFAAPRNRHWIRADRTEQFRGIGLQLLRTAAQLSMEAQCAGRLKLDSSPDFVDWYKKRGLLEIPGGRIIHEGVEYTPMELPAERVSILLSK